jgi:hypothetical protein
MLRGAVVSRRFSLGRALGFVAAMALAASGLTVSASAERWRFPDAAIGMEQLELCSQGSYRGDHQSPGSGYASEPAILRISVH